MWIDEHSQQQQIAVAIVHGMGRQKPDFAVQLQARLEHNVAGCFRKQGIVPQRAPCVFIPIYWAPLADQMQDELENRIGLEALCWRRLRSYIIGYLGDAIAYQPPLLRDQFLVDSIHREFRKKLAKLAGLCGSSAPLCVISHSLGTVISSEYFKAVQQERMNSGTTPLASGRTLLLYYTTGSPIPIWAMRERDYGSPPIVPSPSLRQWYPHATGEWINFYSKFDTLGYPLKALNEAYSRQVRKDMQVASGGWMSRYTPLSHNYYWDNKQVVAHIAGALVRSWLSVNADS